MVTIHFVYHSKQCWHLEPLFLCPHSLLFIFFIFFVLLFFAFVSLLSLSALSLRGAHIIICSPLLFAINPICFPLFGAGLCAALDRIVSAPCSVLDVTVLCGLFEPCTYLYNQQNNALTTRHDQVLVCLLHALTTSWNLKSVVKSEAFPCFLHFWVCIFSTCVGGTDFLKRRIDAKFCAEDAHVIYLPELRC